MTNFDHLPQPRFDDLVLTEAGNELLVFDSRNHQLHHLNPVATATWRALPQVANLADLRARLQRELGTPVSDDAVRLAIASLGEAQLLTEPVSTHSLLGNQSRRRFLKRAGIAGAAIPVIASITAPDAAAMSSPLAGAPDSYICTTGQADMSDREGTCLPQDSGKVCCNTVGKCGTDPQGQPIDVACGRCTFNSGYTCPPGFWGGYQYPPVPGQGGPTAEWMTVCKPRFFCI